MSGEWTPPPFGAPCWVNIPVIDVARAFQRTRDTDTTTQPNHSIPLSLIGPSPPLPANLNEKDIAIFSFPSHPKSGALCGSFERVDAKVHTKGDSAFKMYFMVEDDKKTAEAIIANGGAVIGERTPEGDHGFITQCRDTEGNGIGIYINEKECSG
ncbi:hypothetical protein BDDG_03349 [Blastomyces dermatitidis ATCC 18188]|uniref:VOC domain-containing protein n=1 Tax=Ajellomyces dermatitidis (strain ATCC 18188 / CBS 674.68) TaxID=653446 RepID=F2TAZ5_AJEDA|nr:hypothetical protein BDDG_03349 [Blastomyces dermatitidis ATCC 18188]